MSTLAHTIKTELSIATNIHPFPTVKQALFNWLDQRASGVLLHPSSLPGEFGIGTLNDHCLEFIDFLSEAGLKYWQICPLGPTGYGNSPYQSFSAFAGNPYLISLRELQAGKLLDPKILDDLAHLPQTFVDYGGLYMSKWAVLDSVYEVFVQGDQQIRPYGSFTEFKAKHKSWLEPFAYFQALKAHFDGKPWYEWPKNLRSYKDAKSNPLRKELERDIDAQKFFQYLFYGQWENVRAHAKTRGVEIIGDLPIFVALDSADIWQNPEQFQLDPKTGLPTAVAGCPPDYFAEDGQLWGNPLYDWAAMKKDGFKWWVERLNASFDMYDIVRIDHFRGFDTYWSIPYGSPTARIGEWTKGPGIDFFKAIQKGVRNCKLIAEDLGELCDTVDQLRADTGLPGMSVLQFAFDEDSSNIYLPHNLDPNTVIYSGTHDNDTTIGWYANAPTKTKDSVRRYYEVSGENIGWDFIRSCFQSVAKLAIFPLQDLFSLGSEARFNTPGAAENNWEWRYEVDDLQQLRDGSTQYLRDLGDRYNRTTHKDPTAPI